MGIGTRDLEHSASVALSVEEAPPSQKDWREKSKAIQQGDAAALSWLQTQITSGYANQMKPADVARLMAGHSGDLTRFANPQFVSTMEDFFKANPQLLPCGGDVYLHDYFANAVAYVRTDANLANDEMARRWFALQSSLITYYTDQARDGDALNKRLPGRYGHNLWYGFLHAVSSQSQTLARYPDLSDATNSSGTKTTPAIQAAVTQLLGLHDPMADYTLIAMYQGESTFYTGVYEDGKFSYPTNRLSEEIPFANNQAVRGTIADAFAKEVTSNDLRAQYDAQHWLRDRSRPCQERDQSRFPGICLATK